MVNDEVLVLLSNNSSNFILIVELRNLVCINLICEDDESQIVDNVARIKETLDEFINDDETIGKWHIGILYGPRKIRGRRRNWWGRKY